VIALLLAAAAFAGSSNVVWTRTGQDASGFEDRQRFEIHLSGGALWEGNHELGGCSDTGGRFEGTVTPEEQETFAKAARELVSKSRKRPRNNGIVTHLLVESDGKVEESSLRGEPDLQQAFEERIGALRRRMTPASAVRIRAEESDGKLRAVFEHLGDRPLALLLPENAGEAFGADGKALEYAVVPKERSVSLSPGHPRVEVELKLPPGGAARLRYSNRSIRHHGADATPLELCVPVTRSRR
jgi:hypothetical protein